MYHVHIHTNYVLNMMLYLFKCVLFYIGSKCCIRACVLIILTFLKECTLTINLESTGFNVGDTFALPVTVKDYSRKDIVSASIHNAYDDPIGRVPALVCKFHLQV